MTAPKESNILPANVALNDKIRQLRDRWECNVSTCHSEHCFVPVLGPHLPLSHEIIEKWAAAWLCDKTRANLENPPQHALFNKVAPQTLAQRSPILQAHINNMNMNVMVTPALAAPPVINIVMPNNMFALFHPAPAPDPAVPGPTINPSSALIPSHL
ncbi:hypothetical protein DXG01_007289 [Tephrocybe rancida]|nr:hypothetical protein DXG01_007289 [Tephrocybe rancida]